MRTERKVALSEAKAKLSELVEEVRAGGDPVVIRKRDKDVVVILNLERFLKLRDIEDTFLALQLRKELRGGTRSLRKVLAELELEV